MATLIVQGQSGADNVKERLAALLQIQGAGVQQHRVLRLAQRGDVAVGVLVVAVLDIPQHTVKIRLHALGQQLLQTALGPGRGGGGEIDLQFRLWQHHGADIAPVHEDVILPRGLALHLQQEGAHDAQRRDVGGADGDLRGADGGGNVLAVEVHALLTLVVIAHADVQFAQDGAHGLLVMAVDAAAVCGQADGAVNGARVHVQEAELRGSAAGQRAFTGSGGAVNGNGKMSVHMYSPYRIYSSGQAAQPAT